MVTRVRHTLSHGDIHSKQKRDLHCLPQKGSYHWGWQMRPNQAYNQSQTNQQEWQQQERRQEESRERGGEKVNKGFLFTTIVNMSKLNKGNTPLPFNVPLNSSFNEYLINTNALRPTKTKPLSGGSDPVKINKIKFL
jgi:hypothetical protein